MRKKSLILLTSGILGISLAGGTFAAWAVTDSASPFSIKVSPGQIHTDSSLAYVQLKWGESQNIGDVSGLELDSYKKAGVLDLVANTSDGLAISATLSYAVADSELTGLAQYVNVDVYPGNLDEGAFNAESYSTTKNYAVGDFAIESETLYKCKTATTGTFTSANWEAYVIPSKVSFTEYAATINVTDNSHNLYTVIVSLGNSITPQIYSTLGENEVSITFDWNRASDKGAVFYANFGDVQHVYAYAWSSADNTKVNAAWPGVEMNLAMHEQYRLIAIDTTMYDMVIFNDGTNQSGDLNINTFFSGSGSTYTNNCFTYNDSVETTKGTASAFTDTQTSYYLVGQDGKIGSSTGPDCVWDENDYADKNLAKITINENGIGTITVYNNGNGKYKVHTPNDKWYGVPETDNFIIGDAGTYVITFDLTNPQHLYIA